MDNELLLIVDIQNDFCVGGSLAVPNADQIVPVVNRLAERFPHVGLTQDWHPKGHLSFASSHPGKNAFETIQVSYGSQVLWPDHCVQDTHGAAFHSDFHAPKAEFIVRKGYNGEIDSYSAFYENDHVTPTGLTGRCCRLFAGQNNRKGPIEMKRTLGLTVVVLFSMMEISVAESVIVTCTSKYVMDCDVEKGCDKSSNYQSIYTIDYENKSATLISNQNLKKDKTPTPDGSKWVILRKLESLESKEYAIVLIGMPGSHGTELTLIGEKSFLSSNLSHGFRTRTNTMVGKCIGLERPKPARKMSK